LLKRSFDLGNKRANADDIKQVTYLNSVVMPDDPASSSESDA